MSVAIGGIEIEIHRMISAKASNLVFAEVRTNGSGYFLRQDSFP
jgi:hypothetical protein